MPQEGEFAVNGDIALPGLFPRPPLALQIERCNVRQSFVAKHRLDSTPGNFIASHGMWPTIRPVVLKVFVNEVLQEWTLLLGWSTIASLGSFSLLPSQHFLGDRFGDLPDTSGIPLTAGLKIVVSTLPTLVNTHGHVSPQS